MYVCTYVSHTRCTDYLCTDACCSAKFPIDSFASRKALPVCHTRLHYSFILLMKFVCTNQREYDTKLTWMAQSRGTLEDARRKERLGLRSAALSGDPSVVAVFSPWRVYAEEDHLHHAHANNILPELVLLVAFVRTARRYARYHCRSAYIWPFHSHPDQHSIVQLEVCL